MADISSLVQESLSVSGILLGKTMGRSAELAERFEGESQRLAELEVRSRMTGRWMMAVDPDDLRDHAGRGLLVRRLVHSGVDLVGTLVAFTTLQTRLFAPVGSLLSISVDVQSSLALFDRIFEYLDLPVDIEPGTRTLEHVRGDVRIEDVWFRYGDGEWALDGIDVAIPAGHDDGDRRRDRRRQDDARLPRLPALRPDARRASRSTASTCASST